MECLFIRDLMPVILASISALSLSACGSVGAPATASGSGSKSTNVTGAAKCFNGATTAVKKTSLTLESDDRTLNRSHIKSLSLPATGFWTITPNQFTVNISEIDFIAAGQSSSSTNALSTTCTAVYDSTQPSLTQLANCVLTVSPGSYVGVTLVYSNIFTAVVTDTVNGIYSDPNQTSLLNTTPPISSPSSAGSTVTLEGPGPAPVTGNGQTTTFFPTTQTYSATNKPLISIFIDPTHFLSAKFNGTTFDSSYPLSWSGGQSIYAVASTSAKALLFSTGSTTGNYATGATSIYDLKIFFSGATTPAALNGGPPCASGSAWAGAPTSSCGAQTGGCFGVGGYLGLDTSGNPNDVLSWAVPTSWTYATYAGVGSFTLPTTISVGDTVQVNAVCSPTPTAVTPSSGASVYSKAPTLSGMGGTQPSPVPFTLLAD